METTQGFETPLLLMKAVVDKMTPRFDSHEFILKLIWECPEIYGELLIKHRNVTTAHGEISNYLRYHASELGIKELYEKAESEDLFRIIRSCAQWEKTI